jgi:S-DNA-T family DNA segregation ATPase FtsK/SpoIIIE
MHVVFAHEGLQYDLELRFDRPDCTVADLISALAPRLPVPAGAPGLFVDGLFRPGDEEVDRCGLHEGATIAVAPGAAGMGRLVAGALAETATAEGDLMLKVLSGIDAGSSAVLPVAGEYTVGRAPECHFSLTDATVSWQHCGIIVGPAGAITVVNYSAAAGTRIGGRLIDRPEGVALGAPILIGDVTLAVDRGDPEERIGGFDRYLHSPGASGTVPFNRPPRMAPDRRDVVLTPPSEPKDAGRAPFSVASVLAPAAFGLVMVLALHSFLYALFALLSPVMVLGNWWETRHRSVRALRTSTRAYARELEAFAVAVEEAWRVEAEQMRQDVPSLADVVARTRLPSVRLWERRPEHEDFLLLSLGYGDAEWKPKLATERIRPLGGQEAKILSQLGVLYDVPVTARLGQGGVIGVTGPRAMALAVARSLVAQAAALHGPADLRMAFFVAPDAQADWDFAKWLPHTRDQAGGAERRLVAGDDDRWAELFPILTGAPEGRAPTSGWGRTEPEGPATFYLFDGADLTSRRSAPARRLISGQHGIAAGAVVAASADQLPSVCSEIIELSESGEATLTRPRQGRRPERVRPAGLPLAEARQLALRLSVFEDPELKVAGAGLPPVIRLGGVLGVERWTAEEVDRRWHRADAYSSLRAAVGAEEAGVFELDLDRHGPHGLIGGTTGSGKSELLRTLVASLAATYPPEQLTVALFDFKGGSTFTELAALPHTVGVASDLDVNLARRALRCLRAELQFRERVLDQAGAADLFSLQDRRRRGDPDALAVEGLPRLVVIIDEFAAMAKEVSEEIGAIADLTARGRSLGVHLILATQKPSGAVSAEVRTNTRLRISLKVEDRQDSIDVVGIPDAASIDHKGRGYFRVGQGEVLPIQTALSTGPSPAEGVPPVAVLPFAFQPEAPPAPTGPGATGDVTELADLVQAVASAFAARNGEPPRRPWPDPLPAVLPIEELRRMPVPSRAPGTGEPAPDVVFALADDPDRQVRYPVGWAFRDGNLLLFGVSGAGTGDALATVAVEFARGAPPSRRHLYVVSGAGELAPLARLAHCAGVVRAADRERQIRLLRRLSDELALRRRDGGPRQSERPAVLLVIDNLESLRAGFEDGPDAAFWDLFVRVYSEGPEVGIYTAGAATRIGAVPAALSAATPTKLLFRLADAADFGSLGVSRASLPTFVPGRAVLVGPSLAVQVAQPSPTLEAEVEALLGTGDPPPGRPARAAGTDAGGPPPLVPLGVEIPLEAAGGQSRVGADRWELVVGCRDRDLGPAVLTLYEAEHALVAGRARCGRSTALLTVATAFVEAAPAGTVLAVAPRRSPLRHSSLVRSVATGRAEVAQVCNQAEMASGPTLLLVDDAELVDDPDGRLAALVASAPDHLHVVGAANADALRGLFGHWAATLRRFRCGLLLQPALDRDGDLLGATLPYRVPVEMPPGRGFLVGGGEAELVQVAIPAPPEAAGPAWGQAATARRP